MRDALNADILKFGEHIAIGMADITGVNENYRKRMNVVGELKIDEDDSTNIGVNVNNNRK